MKHLDGHLAQLEATIASLPQVPVETEHAIASIFADIRAHLSGKSIVEQGMTADDPATTEVETEPAVETVSVPDAIAAVTPTTPGGKSI